MPYTIRNEKNGTALAAGLSVEQVDAWWQANGAAYFGVRTVGETIIVCDAGSAATRNLLVRREAVASDRRFSGDAITGFGPLR
jgi:hypothetical protein